MNLTQSAVTSKQREALMAAFEDGFYDVPRQTMEELADFAWLGVSHQTLSKRLRRAHDKLVSETFDVHAETRVSHP